MKARVFGLLVLGASVQAQALEILSWDATRGGTYSALGSSSAYASTRDTIATRFTGSTIRETPTLTAASVAGIDVLWLGVQVNDTAPITPLSAAEQTVLRDFVLGGGKAVLFAENDTNSANSALVNASLLDPFGYTVANLASGVQNAVAVAPLDPVLQGPYGVVSSLTGGFPGWITAKPNGSVDLMALSTNSQPILSYSPAGSLGAGAGSVFVFADSGADVAGGLSGAQKQDLYANILAAQPVPEPATLAAVGLGLAGLLRRRKSSPKGTLPAKDADL